MSGDTKTHQRLVLPSSGKATGFRVAVAGAADGAAFVLAGRRSPRRFVGSSAACDLVVADRMVSRRHLALQANGDRLRIEDCASKNGTFVDGVRIEAALLSGGEKVTLGDTQLVVERVEGVDVDVPVRDGFGKLLGASVAMRQLYPLCERLAASTVPVLIEGETGTGKELLAEALHELGPRSARPFVVFDCTAVPPSLLEAELFGHERGAFTGATQAREGVFEAANGGTLFIDEIGDLELAMQPKLLRAIEKLEVRRLGSTRPIKIDVRLIFATRRDLERAVQAGQFRDDLFHRIRVGRIELPPLRERDGDVALLARAFARAFGYGDASIPHEILARWEDSHWSGNVRELRNAVLQLLELGTAEPARDVASPDDGLGLRGFVADCVAKGIPLAVARQRAVDELERRFVEELLRRHGGDIAAAAAASGVARRQFFRLKAKLG
jgi:transcriptional regulator with GAF, ATPase, and Fis domain